MELRLSTHNNYTDHQKKRGGGVVGVVHYFLARARKCGYRGYHEILPVKMFTNIITDTHAIKKKRQNTRPLTIMDIIKGQIRSRLRTVKI